MGTWNEARLSVGAEDDQAGQSARLRGSQRAASETKARHHRAESTTSRASDDTDWRVRRKSIGTQQQKHSSWHGASGQTRQAGRMSDFAIGHTSLGSGFPATPATPNWRGTQDTSPMEYESWRRREPPPAYLSPVSDLSHFQDYMSSGTPYPVYNSTVVPNSPTVLMPLTQIMPMTPVLQQYSSSQSMQGQSSDMTHQEAMSLDSASLLSSTASPSSSPSLSKRNSITSEEAKKTLQNSPLSAIALAEVAQQAALQRVEKSAHTGSSNKSRSRRVSQSFEMCEELSVLLNSEPTIPQAIPSLFTTPLNDQPQRATLVNPSRTSNVYIRGLPLDTTDDGLYAICRRFGSITSSKAIIDVQSGTCKGFGFCEFKEESSARDCIVALTHYGYQVSFAKDSFNDRLVNLRDSQSTNLYLSNLPTEFNESVSRRSSIS